MKYLQLIILPLLLKIFTKQKVGSIQFNLNVNLKTCQTFNCFT